jgi:hypothetical protein
MIAVGFGVSYFALKQSMPKFDERTKPRKIAQRTIFFLGSSKLNASFQIFNSSSFYLMLWRRVFVSL